MELSKKQKAFIDSYMDNPMMSIKAHAERLGISVYTVYNWKSRNINGFTDELDKKLQEKWESAKLMASETMFSLAAEGDFKAAKYILDYSGYAPTQKVEAKLNTDINIVIGE